MEIWDGEPTFWEDKEHIEKVGMADQCSQIISCCHK